MPVNPTTIFSRDLLQPYMNPSEARTRNVGFASNLTVARGQAVAQRTAAVDEVQSLAITATGGTYRLGYTDSAGNLTYTADIAFDANAAAIDTALELVVGSGNVAVTGTGPFTLTFGGDLAGTALAVLEVDTTSLTGGTATVTETTAGGPAGEYTAYDGGGSGGVENFKAVAAYAFTTDSTGQVSSNAEYNQTESGAVIFYKGTFLVEDLVNIDANAITTGNIRVVEGTGLTADSIITIG